MCDPGERRDGMHYVPIAFMIAPSITASVLQPPLMTPFGQQPARLVTCWVLQLAKFRKLCGSRRQSHRGAQSWRWDAFAKHCLCSQHLVWLFKATRRIIKSININRIWTDRTTKRLPQSSTPRVRPQRLGSYSSHKPPSTRQNYLT